MAIATVFVLPFAASAEQITVAALGDSLTQGYGLMQEDGFVPQLERWLQNKGEDVVILNAGVSGDTTAGGLSRVAWTLTPDVDAMIVTLGGNDLLRGLAPETSRANLDGILAHAAGQEIPVLLIGLSAPGNFGPEYKDSFDTIYPDLAAKYDTLLVTDFLGALRDEVAADPTAQQRLMQADGIHPSAEGVSLIVAEIGPAVAQLVARATP